jgi:hypothetical protein
MRKLTAGHEWQQQQAGTIVGATCLRWGLGAHLPLRQIWGNGVERLEVRKEKGKWERKR